MQLEFFMPMSRIPTVTSQEKGINYKAKKVYTKDAVKDAKQKFTAHLAKHRPAVPFTGPVRLAVGWHFPATKSHHHGTYKTSKPDTDNLLKLFKDCMTSLGFWQDDAQVAMESSMKIYSNFPGVFVIVESLPDCLVSQEVTENA